MEAAGRPRPQRFVGDPASASTSSARSSADGLPSAISLSSVLRTLRVGLRPERRGQVGCAGGGGVRGEVQEDTVLVGAVHVPPAKGGSTQVATPGNFG